MKLIINKAASPKTALIRAVDNNTPTVMPALVLGNRLPLTIYLADGAGDYAAESGNVTTWTVMVGVGIEGDATDAYTDVFTQTADGKGWEGKIDLGTDELKTRLGSAIEKTLTFEVKLSGPEGERRTVLQAGVLVRAQVIDGESFPGVALPEAVLTPAGTSLSASRIPFADALGKLVDSARLIWSDATQGGRLRIGNTLGHFATSILRVLIAAPSPATVFDSTLCLEGEETTGAAGTGGSLGFQGHDGSGGRLWGWIRGLKENGTSGNPDSFLAFATRSAAGVAEKLRITSSGNVLIGPATSTATVPLDVTAASGDVNARVSAQNATESAALILRNVGSNRQLNIAMRGGSAAGDLYGAPAANLASIHSVFAGMSGIMIGLSSAAPIMFATTAIERARIHAAGGMRIAPAAAPASPADGDIWPDTTRLALLTRQAGASQALSGVIYSQTAQASVTNSTAKTSMLSTGVGSRSTPAGFFVPGKTVRILAHGSHGYGTGSITIRLERGGVTLATLTFTPASGFSDAPSRIEALLTCRTTGAGGAAGYILRHEGRVTLGAVALNTTIGGDLDVTVQFGTASASNTFTHQIGTIEVLN
jgi:hypothetical protein